MVSDSAYVCNTNVIVDFAQEKLNEAVMVLNKSLQVYWPTLCVFRYRASLIQLQEINVQNMNVELVAQMFKNYQSNVLFHLEGQCGYGTHMIQASR